MPKRLSKWKDSRKKQNIQNDIKTLLRKDCEVERIMSFHKAIGMFEEIKTWWTVEDQYTEIVIDDFAAG